ncbi:hypothetical protein BDY24DRAFT_241391 [Mrakia frigida]|uniref:uncharacterized protein n=1 Tax=Mrakia frigida TaxID=29902 RepID=UPI003FCC1B6B
MEMNGDAFVKSLFAARPEREQGRRLSLPHPSLDAQDRLPLVPKKEPYHEQGFGADPPFPSPPPRYLHEMLGRLSPLTVQIILTHPSVDELSNYESFFEEKERRTEVYLEVGMSILRELKPDASQSFVDNLRLDLMSESSATSIVEQWDLCSRIVLGKFVPRYDDLQPPFFQSFRQLPISR